MGNTKSRLLGYVMTLIMMVALFNVPMTVQAAEAGTLMADNLEEAKLTTTLETGGFMITATEDKTVTIDSNDKVAEDGTTFSKRIKLGGSGTVDYRSVHFTTQGASTVTVYAMSSSSSSDRALDLYTLDGTLVDSMDAPGAGLNMKTFSVEAGDFYLASPSSGVNLYGVVIQSSAAPVIKTLGISSLTAESLKASVEVNGFTLMATEDKGITIDGNEKVAEDGTSFTQRLKLGGSGSVEYRSIHFNVTGSSTVTVYAMSSSSSSDRALDLYGIDGTLVDSMDAPGAGLNMKTFTVEAGDYYLASPSSGVNVYEVIVTTGEATAVARRDWADVNPPEITSVTQDGTNIVVEFTLVTGNDGADKANVTMYNEDGDVLNTILVGKTATDEKSATFAPDGSGTYAFDVTAMRNDVEQVKTSEKTSITYALPLTQPVVKAFNTATEGVAIKWLAVEEATSYEVEYRLVGSQTYTLGKKVSDLSTSLTGLTAGESYEIRVKALRGSDEAVSEVITKKVKLTDEREWNFTYFGQSVSSSRNVMEMIDADEMIFSLNSCTIKDDGVTIDGKGGKFTTFHDGISYYYTVVDPNTENFELTATFTVDYINSTPDGQEGFGLLAMDSLGEYGVSSVNHYTNSAGVLATKFEEVIDGVKYSGKDVLGARFVTGITPEVLSSGDSAIAQNGHSVGYSFGYEADDFVQTGEVYTLTLKKTNTGYHASIEGEEEYILYGADKLLQIDPDHVYVGFAVARGCNATITDVQFTTSDPATDPEAMPEPAMKIAYTKKIDSPTTSASENYDFVYVSDVPGTLTVTAVDGSILVDSANVTADVDYEASWKLAKGNNGYIVAFTPEAGYIPGENQELDSYETVRLELNVNYQSFDNEIIYVSPEGTSEGAGTLESPVDIYTATSYVKPGQVIQLVGGVYDMSQSLVIQRGIDGSKDQYIVLQGSDQGRAVLDFTNAPSGMVLWGDYWLVENIDITNTPGNTKGLQIAGHNNIISKVNAYKNGDTGIQISGTGAEGFDKWPSGNLVVNCTSYDNMDPGMNNADGFAAKITVAEGNVFRGCMAYNNLDDGWDLFAKIESGPIGVVTIEDCLAFNNGTLTDGTGDGDGNGFKLGGDGIAVAHVLKDSISYNNNNDGVTSNSNPAVVIENVTSYGNKGQNFALYGKGDDLRSFVMTGAISMAGVSNDDVSEMPSLISDSNYLWMAGTSSNASGDLLTESIFASTDVAIMPTRGADGAIDMHSLLTIVDASVAYGGVIGDTGFLNDSISSLAAQAETSVPAVATQGSYTVVSGDTLSGIALKHYGSAVKWHMIYEMNKATIKNPDMIHIGQLILLP